MVGELTIKNTVYVKNFNDLNAITKRYLYEGFSVTTKNNKHIVLKKNNYGNVWIHVILFVITFLFFYGLMNVAYLIFSYLFLSKKVNVIINSNDIPNNTEEKISSKNSIQSFLEDDEEVTFSDNQKIISSGSPILTFLEKKK